MKQDLLQILGMFESTQKHYYTKWIQYIANMVLNCRKVFAKNQ